MHRHAPIPFAMLLLSFTLPVFAQKLELSVQTGHAASIVSLAFTGDGKVVASGSVDNTIKLWDPITGHQLRALKSQDGTITSLAFSPDDKLLASGSADNSIKLWDFAGGIEKQTLRGHTLYVSSVAFSPDGRTLASGSADQKVILWDVSTGRALKTLLPNIDPKFSMGSRVAFSRQGKTLITSGDVVKIWDVQSGNEVRTIKVEEFRIDPNAPMSIPDIPIAISIDDKILATGGKSVKLWELATGNTLRTFAGGATTLVFSPDGKTIAGLHRTEIRIWNVSTGQETRSWEGVQLGMETIAFHPDGKTLASGNVDHTVTLWDPLKGEELKVLAGHAASVMALALSADGKILVSGVRGSLFSKDSVKIWDPATGQLVRSLTGPTDRAYSLGLSKDGMKLASRTSGGGLGLWDVSQNKQLRGFVANTASGSRFYLRRVGYSGDGRLIAGAGDDAIKLWDAESGRELFTFKGHTHGIWDLAFSPDARTLASGGQDHVIKLWSTVSGQELKTLRVHTAGVGALAFSPDGRKLASGSQDQTIILWDVATGEGEKSFAGHRAWVNALAFSPDGQKLASGSEDGTIRLWDAGMQRPLATLLGHNDKVSSVTFSVNGKLLISGSHDSSMKLWDVATGKELASLFSLNKQDWLVLTPDGLFDGSPASWNQILWRFSARLFDVAPAELFFNEYYHPGLLADLYAGKRPLAPQNISQKDRRQPILRLSVDEGQVAAVKPQARTVKVNIEVGAAPAGAQDVRLFRNGALVKLWRGDVMKSQSKVVLEAEISIVAGPNRLTAYAFNRDNVKSPDSTITITGNDRLKQPGTLYILAVAVNKYANSQFDLRYAIADATDFAAELERQETKLRNFGRTEIVPLHDTQATKANILLALRDLATRVKPEDAVVVYFAGHGTAQQNQFYLIPHDLGYQGARNRVDPAGLSAVLSHSISDRELERAFEGIDAGQFLFVIDACNSGQALEAEEKRRGPMNSRGLAQLAYEKGIYVLTAAQSYQAALEPSDLKHGLLTYALVEEGLKQEAADFAPKDGTLVVREWFSYVIDRVPQMQEQRMRQASQSGRQLVYVDGEEDTEARKRSVQRPRVFFRRELEERPFTVARFTVVN